MIFIFYCFLIAFVTYILCSKFRLIALRKGVIADLNSRTLHKDATPKGGGVVFGFIFLISLLLYNFFVSSLEMVTFYSAIAAACFSIFGLLDDYRNLKSVTKLIVQIFFSFLTIYFFLHNFSIFSDLFMLSFFIALVFLMVWITNSINFMDGIDGLASSLGVFYFFTTSFVMHSLGYEPIPELILGSICFGFIFINFSKNKLFMGDSGSLFLGFLVSFLSISTIFNELLPITYWMIVLSFCLTETTLTTAYRVLFIPKWYAPHRSHAYQNLARIRNNHWKISLGIFLFHVFWLLPLAYFSVFSGINSFTLIFLAFLPTFIFNIKFGPRFSSS